MRIYDDPNYSIVVIGRDGEKTLYEIDKIQTNDNQTSSGVIDLWVKCLGADAARNLRRGSAGRDEGGFCGAGIGAERKNRADRGGDGMKLGLVSAILGIWDTKK